MKFKKSVGYMRKNASQVDIEELFPYTSLKEAREGLKMRSRHAINQSMIRIEESTRYDRYPYPTIGQLITFDEICENK